jgi:hypothetical protein
MPYAQKQPTGQHRILTQRAMHLHVPMLKFTFFWNVADVITACLSSYSIVTIVPELSRSTGEIEFNALIMTMQMRLQVGSCQSTTQALTCR